MARIATLCLVAILSVGAVLSLDASAAEFEAPPAAFQTVPRPAAGETVRANPPCFVFPSQKNHDAYVVEFSSEPTFAANATTRLVSPYMLAVPPEALKPGRYRWRWRQVSRTTGRRMVHGASVHRTGRPARGAASRRGRPGETTRHVAAAR